MKHYLRQAHKVELRINSKLEQLESLRALAEKTTSTLSLAPGGQGIGTTREDILAKLVDLGDEINQDIDKLIDIKAGVQRVIKTVDEPELELLLELRYLCYRSWDYIAETMCYDKRWVHRLHSRALLFLENKHATKSH